jgi:hypothetical protein
MFADDFGLSRLASAQRVATGADNLAGADATRS